MNYGFVRDPLLAQLGDAHVDLRVLAGCHLRPRLMHHDDLVRLHEGDERRLER